jgi:hypothetical protein
VPIPIDPWVEQYRTDPRGTVRSVTHELARGLRDVTVNHDSWEDLRLIDRAATVALADDRSIERRYAHRNELRRGLGAALARTRGHDDPAWDALATQVAAHERELDALGLDLGRALPTTERIRRERRQLRAVLTAVAPASAAGAVLNAPVALVLKGVAAAVQDPAWQATSKGVAGVVFCPLVWGSEAYLVRRYGRRAIAAVLVAAPLGGLAWIGWRERRSRWRQLRAEEVLLATRADDVRAAAVSRDAVRARIDQLVAAATAGSASSTRGDGGIAPPTQSASASTT